MVSWISTAKPLRQLERFRELIDGRDAATVLRRNTLPVNGHLGFTFGAGYLRNVSEF